MTRAAIQFETFFGRAGAGALALLRAWADRMIGGVSLTGSACQHAACDPGAA